MSESLEVNFALETVNLLLKNCGASLNGETLIHNDHGTHNTCSKFIQLVKTVICVGSCLEGGTVGKMHLKSASLGI